MTELKKTNEEDFREILLWLGGVPDELGINPLCVKQIAQHAFDLCRELMTG